MHPCFMPLINICSVPLNDVQAFIIGTTSDFLPKMVYMFTVCGVPLNDVCGVPLNDVYRRLSSPWAVTLTW